MLRSKFVKSEVHVKSEGYKLKAKSGKHRLKAKSKLLQVKSEM